MFILGTKSNSLLLSLNLMGSGSGGSLGGAEGANYCYYSCARTFDGTPLVTTSRDEKATTKSATTATKETAGLKAVFGGE